MRLTNALLALVLICSVAAITPGCTVTKKVRSTLAANEILVQAGAAEDKGDYEKAYELWTEFVDRRPHEAFGEFRLGRVELILGKYTDAANHLRIAHDLKPGNVEYIETLAEALARSGQHAELLSLLRSTVNEGEEGSGYLRLAKYAAQSGMMDEARESLLTAVALHGGTSPVPHLAMADFAREIGDLETEIRSLRYALWFDPADAVILARIRQLGVIPGPSLALDPR